MIRGALAWRAALIGAITGSRSMLGLATVALAPPVATTGPLARGSVRGLLAVAATGELVGDKLPKTPSRLEPGGIGARVVLGGTAAAALAYRGGGAPSRGELAQAIALGVGAAIAGTFGGARWRAIAAKRFGRDLPGALIEDAVAFGGALAAVSRRL
jgi:uncharacterized membrane protein